MGDGDVLISTKKYHGFLAYASIQLKSIGSGLAYGCTFRFCIVVRSLTINTKSCGPSLEPWGTPLETALKKSRSQLNTRMPKLREIELVGNHIMINQIKRLFEIEQNSSIIYAANRGPRLKHYISLG